MLRQRTNRVSRISRISRLGGGGAAAWTPADLVGIRPSLSVALQRSMGLLWQDSGKTVPALVATDPVRVAVCPWTAGEWVAPSDAARPLLYDEGGGKWSLSGDGVANKLVATFAFSAPRTVAANARYTTLARTAVFDSRTSSTLLTFRENNTFMSIFDSVGVFSSSFAPSVNVPFVLRVNNNGSLGSMIVNGVQVLAPVAMVSSALSGMTAMDAAGGSFNLPGRVAGLICSDGDLTGSDASNLDSYLAALT